MFDEAEVITFINRILSEGLQNNSEQEQQSIEPKNEKIDESYLQLYNNDKLNQDNLFHNILTNKNKLLKNNFFNAGIVNFQNSKNSEKSFLNINDDLQNQINYKINMRYCVDSSRLEILLIDITNQVHNKYLKAIIKQRGLTFIKLAHELKNPITLMSVLATNISNQNNPNVTNNLNDNTMINKSHDDPELNNKKILKKADANKLQSMNKLQQSSDSDEEWGVLKTTAIQDGLYLSEHNKRLPNSLTPRINLEVRSRERIIWSFCLLSRGDNTVRHAKLPGIASGPLG